MATFEEKTRIEGVPTAKFFGKLLAEFEQRELDVERSRLEIGFMRQVNNANRDLLNAMIHGV